MEFAGQTPFTRLSLIIRQDLQTTLKDASPTFLPWVWRAGESMRTLFKFTFTFIKATKATETGVSEEAILVTGGSQVVIVITVVF